MPQQINLSTPILLAQKRYFSAQTLVQGLAAFVLVGGALCAYGVWSLNLASAGLRKTLDAQAAELTSLQAALAQSKAGAGPIAAALTQELAAQRSTLALREKSLEELQQGLFHPGWGHSSRLQLLAQTIPAQVWVTQVQADARQLEVSGFTLEPAALNDWVARLAASPLLKDQQLATVKVEHASVAMVKASLGAARPVWTFSLLNAVAKPATVTGSKP